MKSRSQLSSSSLHPVEVTSHYKVIMPVNVKRGEGRESPVRSVDKTVLLVVGDFC